MLLLQTLLLVSLPLLSGLSASLCQDTSCLLGVVGAGWRPAGRCSRGGDSGSGGRSQNTGGGGRSSRGSRLAVWHSWRGGWYNRWAEGRRCSRCRGHHDGRNITGVYQREDKTSSWGHKQLAYQDIIISLITNIWRIRWGQITEDCQMIHF